MLIIIDYIVIGSLLIIPSILACIFTICKHPNYEEFTLGERNVGIFQIAISTVVGFIGINLIILINNDVSTNYLNYGNEAGIFTTTLATVLAILLSMLIFIPVLYDLKLISIFEYLELRFDSAWIRCMASFIFISVTLLLSVFIVRIPCSILQVVYNVPAWVSAVIICSSGIFYSVLGGFTLIIAGHILQLLIILSAVIVLTIKSFETTGGFSETMNMTTFADMWTGFDFSLNLFSNTNDLNMLIGFGFNLMCFYGIHQSQVQRFASMSSFKKANIAMSVSLVFFILIVTLLALMSLVIIAAYCTIKNDNENESNYLQPFLKLLTFTTKLLKNSYGMNGLIIAAIIYVILSLISSFMNSLAVITFEDFLRKLSKFSTSSDTTCTNILRAHVLVYGIIIISGSLIPIEMETFFTLSVNLFFITIGVLGSIFLSGIFLPFVNKFGVCVGFVIGFSLTTIYTSHRHWRNLINELGIGIATFQTDSLTMMYGMNKTEQYEICDVNTLNSAIIYRTNNDWADKMWTLSSDLQPWVGSVITTLIAVLVSVLTGGCCQMKRVHTACVHPVLRFCIHKKKISLDEYPDRHLLRNHLANSYRNVDRLSEYGLVKYTSNFSLFHQRYETIPMDEISQFN